MKYNLEVTSSQSIYRVTSELDRAFPSDKKRIVICDENVVSAAREILPDEEFWISVKANEELKTLEECARLLERVAEMRITREFEMVAIGGGSVQDAVTLIASLYMRGLAWVYVPTTLMSMMDSCIGGKSSINLGRYKNVIGNFYPPKAVYIDPKFVQTLSSEDISCGISEGAKICFAASASSFEDFADKTNRWRATGSETDLLSAIFTALEKKKWFIEIDEFDKNERKLLNFGHSFGHALEAASDFSISHGIGVLIGMLAAVQLSGSKPPTQPLASFISGEISESQVTNRKFAIDRKVFLDALARDKKNSNQEQNLILPDSSGRLALQSLPLNADSLEKCWISLESALAELGFAYEVL